MSEYGRTAEAIERVKNVFDQAGSAPETPGPELVVQAFLRLIETPAGERPFRTLPTPSNQRFLEPYNALAESMRETVARNYKVPELTVLHQINSAIV